MCGANFVIPFSGLIVSSLARGFTRDEERAADAQGLNGALLLVMIHGKAKWWRSYPRQAARTLVCCPRNPS